MPLTEPNLATIEDYNALEEGAPYQLIGGELVMSPSPTLFHQEILANIYSALRAFINKKELGKIYFAPLDVQLSNSDVYQPDILFIRKERLHLLEGDRISIAPDLVVEILSPSNAYYDLTRKKAMYCEHGVEEYWIVDPEQETIELLVKDGTYYRTEAIFRKPAELHSPMFPGFSMKLEEVFAV
ncbi:MAG: Uma2 family endonuclease [Candidatus Kapaibacterium sp.]